ncbi:uncharacterized protein [Parasteatoda tepidariorum]|uniref:uncharacterized protein n=1 Tax=Parasteatoda tepidariorum TaxID=114398 RepID=UPI00077FC2F4|nr:uncharacterized protein LOC107437079 [Parasteatoda tepidariorum]
MLKLGFLLLFMIGGSFAFLVSICDFKKCHKLATEHSLFDIENVLPTAERLVSMCPSIKEVMQCEMQEWNNCLGEDLHDFLNSDNETIRAAVNVYLGIAGLLTDMCDNTTPFHRAYAENIVCIKEVSMSYLTQALCYTEASALTTAYKNEHTLTAEQSACMLTAHVFACTTGEILQDCGEEARATAVEFVKRTKLLKYAICTLEDVEELKSTYLNFLEQETEKRNIFSLAFDLRKK